MSLPVLPNPLFLLDYDGTLAEIVDNPSNAHPHPEVPELLAALSERHPLYLITGRGVRDIGALLEVPGVRVVGVHGMEQGTLGGEVKPLVGKEALTTLEEVRAGLPEIDGLKIEDKGLAVALHYRGVNEAGVEALQRWANGVPEGLDKLWGKKVLELRPSGYSKGRAAVRLTRKHPDKTPLFIGDDTTDEEAFKALPYGLTVKVGEGETAARERLVDVNAAVAYLKEYL